MQQYTYDICAPVHPTAVMTILGTDDSTSPYEGLVWVESYYVSADDMMLIGQLTPIPIQVQ